MANQNLFLNFKANLSGWYSQMKKVNASLSNITKDANRSSGAILGMSRAFNGLNQIIGMGKIYAIGNSLAYAIKASIDMIETTNLFSVALGDMATKADGAVNSIHNLYGLDVTNLQNSVGTFALLARSMGMSSTQAEQLSMNSVKLATDLSSLTNVPITQVMQDLRSGLVGQSETVYKYGIDVTEAGIKSEAMAQGITKSVRNMSQGEKMALRYSAMIRQTSLAQGDFARTLNTPANQLKVLSDRFTTLTRAVGSIFVPLLATVLPYLNAFVIVLIEIANAIAKLFGYEAPKVTDMSNAIGGIGDNADETANSVNKMAKAIKNATLPLDELHTVQDSSASGGGSGVGGASILPDIKLPNISEFGGKITDKAKEIAKSLEPLKPLFIGMAEGLKKFFDVVDKFADKYFLPWLQSLGQWVKDNPDTVRKLGQDLGFLAGILLTFIAVKDVIKLLGFLANITGLSAIGSGLVSLGKGIAGIIPDLIVFIGLVKQFGLIKVISDLFPKLLPTLAILGKLSIIGAGVFIAFQGIKGIIEESEPSWKNLGIALAGVAIIVGGLALLFAGLPIVISLIVGAVAVLAVYVVKYWDDIKAFTIERWNNIKDYFSNLWIGIKAIFAVAWNAIYGATIGKVVTIITGVISNFNSLSAKIQTAINTVITVIATWGSNVKSWFKTAVDNVITAVYNWFTALPQRISDAIMSVMGNIKNIGTAILDGIFSGLWNFGSRISSWAGSLLDKFRNAFDINSPSKVMRDEVGKYMGLGIFEGLDSTKSKIVGSAYGITKGIQGAFDGVSMDMSNAMSDASINGAYTATAKFTADTDGLSNSIYDAVASAVSNINLSGQVIENVINLDGEKIYTNQQRISKGRGVDLGMGVFAR